MKDPKAVRELINGSVPLHLLLEETGVKLPQTIKPQQLSCPFHGRDLSMSARYYPETNSMYCFACKKSWDPISFWMQYSSTRFMESARRISAAYRVDLSKIADLQVLKLTRYKKGEQHSEIDKRKLALHVLERNLRMALPIESPDTAAKMLYVMARARHVEDHEQFAQLTLPLAKRINAALS